MKEISVILCKEVGKYAIPLKFRYENAIVDVHIVKDYWYEGKRFFDCIYQSDECNRVINYKICNLDDNWYFTH